MVLSFTHKVIAAIGSVALVPASFGIVSRMSSSKDVIVSPEVSSILTVEQVSEEVPQMVEEAKVTEEEKQKLLEEYHKYKGFYDNFGAFTSFVKSFRTVSSPLIKLANVAGVNISNTWIEDFLKTYQKEKLQETTIQKLS